MQIPLLLALLPILVQDAAPAADEASASRPEPPSVLVVLWDDVGTDMVTSYGDPDAPCTPRLDALAAAGVRYTRAYTNPTCSPTRAQLLTGRHGFRTGIGTAVRPMDPRRNIGLMDDEVTLAEHLRAAGYATVMTGKWHLIGGKDPDTQPNDQGFVHYFGNFEGALRRGYHDWDRTVDGVTAVSTSYATTQNVTDALGALADLPRPWFVYVAFNAAHDPYHAPPEEACPDDPGCGCLTASTGGRPAFYRAMVESLDLHTETLYRTLTAATGGNLWTFVLGDNGTPRAFAADCPRAGKGLLYEGGVRVPLVVQGPGVEPGVCDDLVCATDLFATIAELCGTPAPETATDSLSFAPTLFGGHGKRDFVYLEWFTPNGAPLKPIQHRRCVIGPRFKLIRRFGQPDALPDEQLFDLGSDPCEGTNLLSRELTAPEQAAYGHLEDVFDLYGV